MSQAMDPMLPVMETLARTQARIGDLDASLKTIAEMGGSSFAKFARNNAIEQIVPARLEAGDVPGARRVADAIPDLDAVFLSPKPNLLEQIAKRQAQQGGPSTVLEWVDQQKIPDTKLKMLRGLADGIAQRAIANESRTTAAAPPSKPAK
jgi:hypothetical protein